MKYSIGKDRLSVVYASGDYPHNILQLCSTTNSQDAESILLAVNAHDKLLEALRNASRQLKNANKLIDCESEIALADEAIAACSPKVLPSNDK